MTFLPSMKSLAISRECADENCASRVAKQKMSQWQKDGDKVKKKANKEICSKNGRYRPFLLSLCLRN